MAKNTADNSVTDIEDSNAPAAPIAPVEATAVQTSAPATTDGLDPLLIAQGFSGKRKTITLSPGEGESGKLDQVFGINGFMILVQRGKPVSVAEEFVQMIKDAKQDIVDTNGTIIGSIPRFNITVE